MSIRWRDAMEQALYGPDGFFVSGAGPADHFRTSVHASPAFAAALHRLIATVDAALDHPDPLAVVDVGAGRGELLRTLHASIAGSNDTSLAHRLRLTAVERAPRPTDLPTEITWTHEIPAGVTGLLLATEWLDNVPLDLAVATPAGWRYLLVDPATGEETDGSPVSPEDADWLARWWSPPAADDPGIRAEIGRTRDDAWTDAVGRLDRGLAVTVDYGHLRRTRPAAGTLTGYRNGRQVRPVPDGSCDVTAHLAVDSVAAAGARVAQLPYTLVAQRTALRALGADGRRPPLARASTDPAGYLRALSAASAVAELIDPAGLGGHWWLLQPAGVALDPLVAP
ncbi:SAM-dependent methyltransferase [Salinispora pacifica]|uniref:SAM-dependent methyltransferase n=1 Tax=Salinispora pacifica TaxID=351187 RepID=UPI0004837C2B|nr:SAM-dependent methyltransferase [Salinispora pacifica]